MNGSSKRLAAVQKCIHFRSVSRRDASKNCATGKDTGHRSAGHRSAGQMGFTLIEVLVALTLMALVSLISWQGLEAVQRTGERLDERGEETMAMVRALGQIERDVLMHAGEDVLKPTTTPSSADDDVNIKEARQHLPAGIRWEPDHGLFIVRSVGDGLWQRLRWYLDNGRLMRAAGTPSYVLPLPEPAAPVAVLDQVQALGVRVWVPGEGWVEAQNDDDSNAARQAPVRPAASQASTVQGLEIALYRQGASKEPYRKVVVLP